MIDLVTEMDRLIDAKLEELSTDRNIEKFIRDVHWEVPYIGSYIKYRADCRKEVMRIAGSFSAKYAPNLAKTSSYETCGASGKQIKRNKAVIKVRGLKKVLKRMRRAKEESRELNAITRELKINMDALNGSLERFNELRKK